MSLISPTDFIGEVSLPNTDQQATSERIEQFIKRYEADFLQKLLGSALYSEFKDNVNQELYCELKHQIKPLLLRYVYYWIIREGRSYVSGMGTVVQGNAENSSIGGLNDRLCKAWNDMAYGCIMMITYWDVAKYGRHYLCQSPAVWGESYYRHQTVDLFNTINNFGL